MNNSIQDLPDIKILVNTFYERVRENKVLGYTFKDGEIMNGESHLSKMYSSWENSMLGERNYSGSPMQKHIVLSKITEMREKDFTQWLHFFIETVDELIQGEKANKENEERVISLG